MRGAGVFDIARTRARAASVISFAAITFTRRVCLCTCVSTSANVYLFVAGVFFGSKCKLRVQFGLCYAWVRGMLR